MSSSISYTIIDYTAARRLALFLDANKEKERGRRVLQAFMLVGLRRWARDNNPLRHLVCVSFRRLWHWGDKHLTAHAVAIDATMPPDINIWRTPRVLLNTIPLSPPATIVFAASCLPRR